MTIRNVFWPSLVVLCLSLSAATGGAVVQAGDGAVGFADSESVEQRGDVATIQLELANTDDAELLIRSARQDYAVDLEVHDGDGDGTVRVRFNTFYGLDGADRPAFSAAGADDGVTVLEQSSDQSLPVLDAGRYNLIAATDTSRVASVLHLENGSVGESRTVVAPRTADSASAFEGGSAGDHAMESNTIARGDVGRVEFEVSGLEGVVQGPNPSEGFVFANDSRPGADTTHLLRLAPDRDVDAARTLSVDYDGSGDATPDVSATARENVHAIGVDETGDGRIDRSLAHEVTNLRTTTDGELRVRFDDPVSMSTSETLLLKYPVTNPDVSGTEDVRVALGPGTYAETGEISYGSPGLGTLGHGVDLRIRNADSRTEIASPVPTATTYDPATNTVTARVETAHLEPADYDVQLRVHEESPLEHDGTVLTERITVAPRSANLSSVELTEGSTLSVDATTNLAPGSRVITEVSANPSTNEGGFLVQCVGVVERDGTVACEFDLPDPLIESTAAVSVRQNGTTLAGPIEYELPAAEREANP